MDQTAGNFFVETAISTTEDWQRTSSDTFGVSIVDGLVVGEGVFTSNVIALDGRQKLSELIVEQPDDWKNWVQLSEKIAPPNLRDAPVFLPIGENDYWLFGRRDSKAPIGSNVNQGEGSEAPALGGYHAWQSTDMRTWTHHGAVTDARSRWVTSAEFIDGKLLIYYDYPNDQDPHLIIDDDLQDGIPGRDMGKVFADESDGSDAGVFRDLDGRVHLIFEDWSPINARKNAWDSPLAGRATSEDGVEPFFVSGIAVDYRTNPTGEFKTYDHPSWARHPDFETGTATYAVHKPNQDAFGDWTAIRVGDQYYLFGDYEPATPGIRADGTREPHMSAGRFTSGNLNEQFKFVGSLGSGHPDPTVGFAEGRFYLITQTQDFVSTGPWIEGVMARAGVDADGDGVVDDWTDWQTVSEHYSRVPGFPRVVATRAAKIDLSDLPEARGFAFELKLSKPVDSEYSPEIDRVIVR